MKENENSAAVLQGKKTKFPRLMFAAPQSGSGKTLLTCSFLELLKEQGRACASFKCGPDYIDPMFHERVIGVPARNLDLFFSDEREIRELFLSGNIYGNTYDNIYQNTCGSVYGNGGVSHKKENFTAVEDGIFRVMEGVMGLYDGLGGIREEASSYHLARCLQAPVILVVDAKGMGRSLLALLGGFLQYDTGHLLKGVILNRVSKSFCSTLTPMIEQELGLTVLGCFPEKADLKLESRHLGLLLPGELQNLEQRVRQAAQIMAEHVDLEKMLEIAENATCLDGEELRGESYSCLQEEPDASRGDAASETLRLKGKAAQGEVRKQVRIGIARDEAFCFYYEDNLRLLREAGAELVPFSPIRDAGLPENIQGILLGGGYPEIWAEQLSANGAMRKSIREAIGRGMPSLAECGGFMYLHHAIVSSKERGGKIFPMCDVLPGDCHDTGRLVRFGYVTVSSATDKNCFLPKKEEIRGHEFHYFDSQDNGSDCLAVKPIGKQRWNCIHADENHWWGFAHLYYPSNPEFVKRFIGRARCYKA